MTQETIIHETEDLVPKQGDSDNVLLGKVLQKTGASSGGGGGAVTVADGADVTQGLKGDAAATTTGTWSIISLLKGIWTRVILPDVRGTGSVNSATLGASYSIALDGGQGVVGFSVVGLTASGATLSAEGSNDGGTTWVSTNTVESGSLLSNLTADGNYRIGCGGRTNIRLKVSVVGVGTVSFSSNASAVSSLVTLANPLPAGTNSIGVVSIASTQSRIDTNTLGQPSVSRQLAAGAASVNTVLTGTCRRISVRARTSDVRFSVGSTSQTANASTSHFIAQDERLDLSVPTTPNIALIRAAATDGTLEVMELI